MRKFFLLIIYIAGLTFAQQGLKAGHPLPAFKISSNSITPLTVKTSPDACKYDCYSEDNFCLSDLNLEDDGNAKSKPVSPAGPSWLQADDFFMVQTHQLKYGVSFRPVFPFDLFKLIRVFRL